jgi:putative transposase
VKLDFSRPGKPTDNAVVESFNGRLRQECLNAHWFMLLGDAQKKVDAWRWDYNHRRPQSALGGEAPSESAKRCAPSTSATLQSSEPSAVR